MTALAGVLSSAELAGRIRATDYSNASATVLGYGNMGREYVKALRFLGVGNVHVCSRSSTPLAELEGMPGVRTLAGGYERSTEKAVRGELGIVATPTADLVAAASHLLNQGFRQLLIEKPVSLKSAEIQALAATGEAHGADIACAYNRVAYPSFHEALFRARQDGGITSCQYTFTEFVHRIGPGKFSTDELTRWGVANSLHVLSMAHGLIGLPDRWQCFRQGAISWHPSGAVFVGAGVSEQNIPFDYHADWGSTGRWSVELHTAKSSYKLCPLEQVFKRTSATGDWDPLDVSVVAPEVKAGVVEEVAAMLLEPATRPVKLPTLSQTAQLTRYAEQVFGYEE